MRGKEAAQTVQGNNALNKKNDSPVEPEFLFLLKHYLEKKKTSMNTTSEFLCLFFSTELDSGFHSYAVLLN